MRPPCRAWQWRSLATLAAITGLVAWTTQNDDGSNFQMSNFAALTTPNDANEVNPEPPPWPRTATQWDDPCLAVLLPEVNKSATVVASPDCLCGGGSQDLSSQDSSGGLAFLDDGDDTSEPLDVVVESFPAIIDLHVSSKAPACGDILEATVFAAEIPPMTIMLPPTASPTLSPTASPSSEGAKEEHQESDHPVAEAALPPIRRATRATVLALANGAYRVSVPITTEGDHQLLVRLAFRQWAPRKECRGDLGCRQVFDSPDSTNMTRPFPYITRRIRASLSSSSTTTVTASASRPCTSMAELSDGGGSWVLDPATMLGYNGSSPIQVAPPNNGGWQATWAPRTCRLQLLDPTELQRVFQGKHFLIIGDSVTHMLMAAMMHLILGNDDFRYPTNGPELCGHNNRVYDSGDMLFPMRFSFLWAGSAHYWGNDEGLPSTLGNEHGRARFTRGLGRDVDFVLMNAGAHDIAGNVPLEDYDRLLPQVMDMVLNASAKVRDDPQRAVWRATTQHIYHVNDWNAGIRWMNWLAERHARRRGFAVLDAETVWMADTELRRANGADIKDTFCGDGLHGRGDVNLGTEAQPHWVTRYCDKVYAEAAMAVQHFYHLRVRQLAETENMR